MFGQPTGSVSAQDTWKYWEQELELNGKQTTFFYPIQSLLINGIIYYNWQTVIAGSHKKNRIKKKEMKQ